MPAKDSPLIVIGGGLAGCEAAWTAATRGLPVELWEMRPAVTTPAHRTGLLAELVCSNSLKALSPEKSHGLLKEELRMLGSLILPAAEAAAIPGGGSLVVDRGAFARAVTRRIEEHPRIRLVRREADSLPPGQLVVATGPLTSPALAEALARKLGKGALSFYDAIAPTVETESIDFSRAFRQDRYGPPGEGAYLNCPLTREEYLALVRALREGEKVPPHPFEEEKVFEACLPVEVLAERGEMTLAFGPMRPTGLVAPAHFPFGGRRPFAVVQLRPEDRAGTLHGLVGFQTKLLPREQERVLRLIPALKDAAFSRLGSIHRNTYLDAPALLDPWQRANADRRIFFAGQITGVEGYLESAVSGAMAGIFAACFARGETPALPPPQTMTGALLSALAFTPSGGFAPVNAQMGLLPPLSPPPRGKGERRQALSRRAIEAMRRYAESCPARP
jgi:methylenetetrahydrofolate--tRNA-(uracil-5-)-methyltransferase